MSEAGKQKLGDWFTWTFLVATAIGAFFLVKTYDSIERNNQLLQLLVEKQAIIETFTRTKISQHDNDLSRAFGDIRRLQDAIYPRTNQNNQ